MGMETFPFGSKWDFAAVPDSGVERQLPAEADLLEFAGVTAGRLSGAIQLLFRAEVASMIRRRLGGFSG
jgi:hypothetical protein